MRSSLPLCLSDTKKYINNGNARTPTQRNGMQYLIYEQSNRNVQILQPLFTVWPQGRHINFILQKFVSKHRAKNYNFLLQINRKVVSVSFAAL